MGSGPTLVLVHGLGGSLVNWEPVMELVARERDVIAVDLPGFGDSDPLPDGTPHSPVEMGRAITAHLRSLGVERPHVAGNSLGAWATLEMAADGEVASVLCISPAGLWRNALGPRTFNSRRLGSWLRPLVMGVLATERGRRALLRGTVARPDLMSKDEARRWVGAWLDAPGYDDANKWMRKEPFSRADEIDVPVTIVWGEEDGLVAPPRPERMPAHTDYKTVAGWGHTPTRDDPEGVARLLVEASAELPAPAAAANVRAT
jgi:pimeloyl-ACP methyl ester carboxylesterase